MQGEEPSAGLVNTFADEVRSARCIGVLKRIVVLRIGHSAGVEPNVNQIQFAAHRFAGRRNQDYRIHIRTVQIDHARVVVLRRVVAYLEVRPGVGCHHSGCHGFVDLGKQFFDTTDAYLLLPVLGAPYRQRCAPVARAREVPVVQVLQPFTEASCAGRFGLPIDGFVQGNHLIACGCGTYEPRVERVIHDRRVGTPAMRVVVHVLLNLQHCACLLHLHTQTDIDILSLQGFLLVVAIVCPEVCLVVSILYKLA